MDQTSDEELRWKRSSLAGQKIQSMIKEYRRQQIRQATDNRFQGSILQAAACDLSVEIINAMGEIQLSTDEQRLFCLSLANDLLTSTDPTYRGELKHGTELR